jgi:small subunit ribosomal protein S3
MGQKISVKLFRARKKLPNVSNNSSAPSQLNGNVWFAEKGEYADLLLQDLEIKKYIKERFTNSGIAKIVVRRYFRKVEVTIFTSKPGLLIGKSGASINSLKSNLIKKFGLPEDLKIEILEFKDPYSSAQVVADEIAHALQRGLSFRRLAKNYLDKIRYSGVAGARIWLKGRLNNSEIARKEEFNYGSIPRHTYQANIDYYYSTAMTKSGVLGIKVWLYLGDKIKNFNY